jgi:hypothetical protein
MHRAMAEAPGLVGRVVAYLHHEVAGDALAPYRSAGGPVYALAEELEQLRLGTLVDGGDPWRFPTPVQTARLCGWNALALQMLGDQMVDSDTEADPKTAGFVDPVLAEQAVVFYGQVPRWFSRAHQALTNPGYRLDVGVPVPLPDGPSRPPNVIYVNALIDSSSRLCMHVTALWATCWPFTNARVHENERASFAKRWPKATPRTTMPAVCGPAVTWLSAR